MENENSINSNNNDMVFNSEQVNNQNSTSKTIEISSSLYNDNTDENIKQNFFISFLSYIENNLLNHTFLRFLNVITIFIFFAIMLSALIYFNIKEARHNYILLNIDFYPDSLFPFLTDPYAFLLALFALTSTFISICNTLILNKRPIAKSFIKDTGILLFVCLLCIAISFIIGIFSLKYLHTMIINLILYTIGLIAITIIVARIRKHNFCNKESVVNQGFMPSILMSILSYLLIYTVSDLLTRHFYNVQLVDEFKREVNIYANLVYFALGVGVLTFNRDIIYPLCLVIFDTGMLTKTKLYSFKETLVILLVTLFTFGAVVITIFKNKTKIFRINPNEKRKFCDDGEEYEKFDD